MKIEDIKNKLEKAIIAVATVDSDNKPHTIAIMYAKIKEGKVVITNNYMDSTIKNLKTNPYISLVFWEGEDGYRIDGEVEYFDSGKWLEFVRSLPENKGFAADGALVVDVDNITELG